MKRLFRLPLILLTAARLAFAQSGPVITRQMPHRTVYGGAPPATIDLTQYFDDPDTRSAVRMFTSLGELDVVLLPTDAPKTVENFLNYVNRGAYTSSLIHRSIPGFVIQGGGFMLSATPSIDPIPQDSPVPNEFKVSNTRGTIAMALSGSENSATNQWFFNETDNTASGDTNLDNAHFTLFIRRAASSMPII